MIGRSLSGIARRMALPGRPREKRVVFYGD
jgi:hypothetical protein